MIRMFLESSRLPPAALAEGQVASCSRAELVDGISPGPDTTLALNNADDLFGQSLGKSVVTTAPALLLGDDVQDPHHCLPAALAEAERHGNLQCNTTTCSSTLAAETEERRNAVDGESEV